MDGDLMMIERLFWIVDGRRTFYTLVFPVGAHGVVPACRALVLIHV
jgi:hypothetical protein